MFQHECNNASTSSTTVTSHTWIRNQVALNLYLLQQVKRNASMTSRGTVSFSIRIHAISFVSLLVNGLQTTNAIKKALLKS
jgi:hypothetical protein